MIYSPSQTRTFLTCPTARMLSQEGWTQRTVSRKDWAAWIGQGVHAGLAYKYDPVGIMALAGGILSKGAAGFTAEYDYARAKGRLFPPSLYKGEGLAQVERCLEYALEHPLLPEGFQVTGTEVKLEPYNCILDVVGTLNGKPTFIDWKIKLKLKPDYYDQELEKYRYEWKEARHYPWALSQHIGQQVEEYTVVIFVLEPFKVLQRTYKVNWKVVERWAQGSKGVGIVNRVEGGAGLWATMDYADVWQSNQCHPGAYGFPCEYLDACWNYDLDREMMKNGGYIQIERRK